MLPLGGPRPSLAGGADPQEDPALVCPVTHGMLLSLISQDWPTPLTFQRDRTSASARECHSEARRLYLAQHAQQQPGRTGQQETRPYSAAVVTCQSPAVPAALTAAAVLPCLFFVLGPQCMPDAAELGCVTGCVCWKGVQSAAELACWRSDVAGVGVGGWGAQGGRCHLAPPCCSLAHKLWDWQS